MKRGGKEGRRKQRKGGEEECEKKVEKEERERGKGKGKREKKKKKTIVNEKEDQ